MDFSVLICVYNKDKPEWFEQTLRSLHLQTKKANEIILIIDGNISKKIESIIEEYKKNLPIKVFRNLKNKGLAFSLNKGLSLCSNELVARLDSDDIALPHRFEKQINFMLKNPATTVLGGSINIINYQSKIVGKRLYPKSYKAIKEGMWRNTIAHGTVMYRKTKILKEGAYNINCRRGQDYDLWFRLLKRGEILENLDEIIGYWRYEPDDFFKSSFKQKLQQVIIGFKGTRSIGLPLWKQFICLAPLIPYFLPKFLAGFYMKLKNYLHN